MQPSLAEHTHSGNCKQWKWGRRTLYLVIILLHTKSQRHSCLLNLWYNLTSRGFRCKSCFTFHESLEQKKKFKWYLTYLQIRNHFRQFTAYDFFNKMNQLLCLYESQVLNFKWIKMLRAIHKENQEQAAIGILSRNQHPYPENHAHLYQLIVPQLPTVTTVAQKQKITYHLFLKKCAQVKTLRCRDELKCIHGSRGLRSHYPFFPSFNNKVSGEL